MSDLVSPVWDDVAYPITADFLQLVTWPDPDNPDCSQYSYSQDYCVYWSSDVCYHPAVDVGTPFGTTLKAPQSGTIVCAGTGDGCAGFACTNSDLSSCGAGRVEMRLADNSRLILGHCSQALVGVGAQVAAGTPIAKSGRAGTGDHVHIELRVPNAGCTSGYEVIDRKPLLTGATVHTFVVGDTLAVDDSEGLNLRTGPGLGYSIITTMPWNRKGIVVSGPIVADSFHWYELETRHGRGWAAAGEYMKKVTLPNYTANPTANSNLDSIVPNRQATTLARVYLDGNWRVRVTNPGSGTMEGVRYESEHGMGWTGQQYFGGILHQLKGTNGQVLDYVRVSIYYTDGTGSHSSPYSVTMDGTWHHVIPFHVASDPAKTIDWVTIKAIRNSPQAMTFYTDNAWVVEL
jgi:murein DD-endopeptidase MepM/ murein hydrolase activator NlpD